MLMVSCCRSKGEPILMSFSQFFAIVWARRWIAILATVMCVTAAVIAGLILPSRYEAHARLIFENFKPDPITGEVMNSQFARAYVSTQIELLKDEQTTGRVVRNLGWETAPALLEAYERRSESDQRDFGQFLSSRVSDNLAAKLVPGSNILDISYTSTDPAAAATIAEAVRDAYIEQAVSTRRNEAATSASWLKEQSARLRTELLAAERKKAEFERANGIVLQNDNTDTDTARLMAMSGASPAAQIASMTEAPNPAAAQLAQVDAQIANAAKVLGPNNPELLAMRRQRDALAASASVRAPVRAAAAGPSLAKLYSDQQRKVLESRGKVAEAQQLASDVLVLRTQYAKTTARGAELEQQGEVTDAGLTSLGRPTIPSTPSFPRWPLLIFGSLGAGLALGVLAGLALELTNRRVRGSSDLEYRDVPVIGTMTREKRGRGMLSAFRRFFSFRSGPVPDYT